jgi:hypothetical protein
MANQPKVFGPVEVSAPARTKGTGEAYDRLESALILILGLSLPFTDFPLFALAGFEIDLAHVFGGLLLLVAAAGAILNLRPRPAISLELGPVALLLVPLMPYAFHRLPGFSVEQFWRTLLHLAFMLAVFLAIGSARPSPVRFRRLLFVLAGEAILLSLYGIWQTVAFSQGWPTGIDFLNRFAARDLRGESGGAWRSTATFEEPKWLAIYLLTSLVYAYGLAVLALREGRSRAKNLWLAAMLLICAGVVATESLGEIPVMAILLLAAFVHLLVLLRGKAKRTLALAAMAVALLGLAASALLSHSSLFELFRVRVAAELTVPDTADPQGAPSWAYRENLRYAILIFRESPWFGIGVGQFAPVGGIRGRDLGISPELTRDGPWIGLGGLLAEFGLIGVAALALLLVAVLKPRGAEARAGPNPYGAMPALLVAAVLLKETSAGFYVHLWTWFPLGIAALAARGQRPEEPARSSGE